MKRPPIELILELEKAFRRKASAGELKTIKAEKTNPAGEGLIPIMNVSRSGWRFLIRFSSSHQAFRSRKMQDWVVVSYDDGKNDEKCTVVTASKGPSAGRRVVRGRETDWRGYYVESSKATLFGDNEIYKRNLEKIRARYKHLNVMQLILEGKSQRKGALTFKEKMEQSLIRIRRILARDGVEMVPRAAVNRYKSAELGLRLCHQKLGVIDELLGSMPAGMPQSNIQADQTKDENTVSNGGTLSAESAASWNQFIRKRKFWHLTFEGNGPFIVQDLVGMKYIAKMLGSPKTDFHYSDFSARPDLGDENSEVKEAKLKSVSEEMGFADLDKKGREKYGKRLKKLVAEREEARLAGETELEEEIEKRDKEIDFIKKELKRDAFHLNRRRPPISTSARKAMNAISKAIKVSIAEIRNENEDLAKHLNLYIKKGRYLRYLPDKPIVWVVSK